MLTRVPKKHLFPLCSALGLLLIVSSCSAPKLELQLVFPNDNAKLAADELELFVFSQDGVDGRADVRCSERLGRIAQGKPLGVDPFVGALSAPFAGQEIADFPAGNPVVFVLAYRRIDAEQRFEYMEGCTELDATASESGVARVVMKMIQPSEIFLEKSSGDLQASLLGRTGAIPLRVRATAKYANAPRKTALYTLPGLALKYEPVLGIQFVGSEPGAGLERATDIDGYVEVQIEPQQLGQFDVRVSASGLTDDWVTFRVSALAPLEFENRVSIHEQSQIGRQLIAAKIGKLMGDSESRDVVILSCEGDAEHCKPGRAAVNPPGATRITVLVDPTLSAAGSSFEALDALDLGLGPSGLLVDDLIADQSYEEIAIINSRHEVLGGGETIRAGSELLILQGASTMPSLVARVTLNSSNAIGLATYRHNVDDLYPSLLTVSQGRPENLQRCDMGVCLPGAGSNYPACPAGESCACDAAEICHCVAPDRFVDKIINESTDVAQFYNVDKCHLPVMGCDKSDPLRLEPPGSTCFCTDQGTKCSGSMTDYCRCRIPRRNLIGSLMNSSNPNDVTSGVLRAGSSEDLVIAADSGLRFFQLGGSGKWKDIGFPVLSDVPRASLIVDVNNDTVNDVIWYSTSACNPGTCDIQSVGVVAKERNRACLGILARSPSDPGLYALKDGHCRSYPLPFVPTSMCAGHFDDEPNKPTIDLAFSAAGNNAIAVYLGNGMGGFLTEPNILTLAEGQVGGEITCGDLNGDGKDEIVVVNSISNDVTVFWTKS